MTIQEAIAYLESVGVLLVPAPRKFKTRGFDYYAPSPSQMLSEAGVIEFATNERELRQP